MNTPTFAGVEACGMDANGSLFDVNSAARTAQSSLGERWQALAELWRAKQLQYSWLRGLTGHHRDFWQVTGDALDFAMSTTHVEDSALRSRLMNLYLVLSAYPEVPDVLTRLKTAGMKVANLSNGTPAMFAAAVSNAGIVDLLDAVLSVEEVKVYKPHPSVYRLACERLKVPTGQVCPVSSNSWDAYSAKAFGFRARGATVQGNALREYPRRRMRRSLRSPRCRTSFLGLNVLG
jgi:2-haloacid dehalogenase